MNETKPLSRSDQALLFLYIVENGLPSCGASGRERQEIVFARLMNIRREEAVEAFVKTCEDGFTGFEVER